MPPNNADHRLHSLTEWLKEVVPEPHKSLEPASADASFRRYFRLQTERQSYVVMDAPPDKEPIDTFLKTVGALSPLGVHVPKVYAHDRQQGFIVLEDLGTLDYLSALNISINDSLRETSVAHHNNLYTQALKSLVKLQSGDSRSSTFVPPTYDSALLEQELEVFREWYLHKHLNMALTLDQAKIWDTTKDYLIKACLEQPQVWVHRDFHSRNLMVCEQSSPGVIDFQDMVVGPIAYDVVSLFKDCYVQWPRAEQLNWCDEFCQLNSREDLEPQAFIRWFDLTGIQRHLKVLGVFSRLHHRDGKSQYLNDLPLVRDYLFEALDLYSELNDFKTVFANLPHA